MVETLQLIVSKIAPIDIASIIASIASIVVAVIGARSISNKAKTDEQPGAGIDTISQADYGNSYALIVCFFIYAFCGFLTASLLWLATFTGTSTWGSTNLVWVVGNSLIIFILYKKYLSALLN